MPGTDASPLSSLPSGRRRSPSRWRLVVWIAGLAAALILFLLFGLPPIVKSQAEKRLTAALHRPVTIERVRLNPFRLSAEITGLHVGDNATGTLVGWRRLYVNAHLWARLGGTWRFEEVTLAGFEGNLARAPDGTLNIADLLPAAPTAASAPPKAKPRPLAIDRLVVTDAHIRFSDTSRRPAFHTTVGPVSFTLLQFRTDGDPRAPYEFAARTESGEAFSWKGTLSIDPLRSQGEFTVQHIDLSKYAPYYRDLVRFTVETGKLSLRGRYVADLSSELPDVRLTQGEITLEGLRLAPPGGPPVLTLTQLTMAEIEADLRDRRALVGRLDWQGGQCRVRRTPSGLDLATLFAPPSPQPTPAPAAPAPSTVPAPASASSPAGPVAALPDLRVRALSLQDIQVELVDETTSPAVQTRLETASFKLQDFALRELATPRSWQGSATLATGGTLQATGTAALQPLALSAHVTLVDLALPPFSPYLETTLAGRLTKGRLGFTGDLRFEESGLHVKGDASLDDFALATSAHLEDIATWSSLRLTGITLANTNPLDLGVDHIEWSTLAARFVIREDGNTSLSELIRRPPAPKSSAATEPVPPSAVPSPSTPPPIQATATPPASRTNRPKLRVGQLTLKDARGSLTDRSLQPPVGPIVARLDGTVKGLSSDPSAQAVLDLRGAINESAPLELAGTINVLGAAPFADARLSLRSLDLAPIAPYVSKYAGYALERGSLSLAVKLNLAEGAVRSEDVATLEQFTLGAPTPGPDATSLPVTLALALLKDRSGRIVLDVPVEGRLDDPSFRIGRVIGRVLVNLLAKAATSPFALLGAVLGGGGGGEELSFQLFSAGQSELLDTESAKLTKLAQALVERPAVRLDIAGQFDPVEDRTALQRAELDRQLRAQHAEHIRATAPQGIPPPAPSEMTLTEAARAHALATLHRQAFPDSPLHAAAPVEAPASEASPPPPPPRQGFWGKLREGLLGSTEHRSSPGQDTAASPRESQDPAHAAVADSAPAPTAAGEAAPVLDAATLETMATELAQRIIIDDNALRELAAERAQRIRTQLVQAGQVPAERVFIVAPGSGGARVNLQLK